MAGIDSSLEFHPLTIAVLVVSDTRDLESDRSGAYLAGALEKAGHRLAARALVADDVTLIREQVSTWVGDPVIDVILTTGGTGFAPRDVTPEAIGPMLTKIMDGFAVLFHVASQGTVGLSTLQSRALAGQIDETFIFCLPGSTGACRDGWAILGEHFDSRYRPCSLAGQVPRLRERLA